MITTSHPGPYTDILFNALSKEYELDVIYHRRQNPEKPWKAEDFFPGADGSSMGFYSFAKCLLKGDIVVLWGYNSVRNMAGAVLCTLTGRRVGIFMDHPDPERMRPWKSVIKRILFLLPIHLLGASRSCIDFMQRLIGIPEKRSHLFPYPIAPAAAGMDELNQSRDLALRSGARIRLLLANRFIERKNYQVVLAAFRRLKAAAALERFQITIIGNGPLLEEYKIRIKDLNIDVQFLGWVENADYLQLMQQTDIFLHASAFEPFGIPPVDAMEHGKLVIVADGVKSLSGKIRNGMDGFEFPANDDLQLCEILLQIVLDPGKIYEIGKGGRILARGYHASTNLLALKEVTV